MTKLSPFTCSEGECVYSLKQPTFYFATGRGFEKRPVKMLFRIIMMKLTENILERNQTNADIELQPKLHCHAPTCGNTMLVAL
jgi:hypothetical protein